MKRNMLELGGKSAYLILDDADMDMALPGCLGALMHSGQGCALATRMLVPRSHYDQAVEVARRRSALSPSAIPRTRIPSAGRWSRPSSRPGCLNYIEIAKADGGRDHRGGGVPDGLDRGFFVAPTVVADVAPDHTIFQEEVFGPVLSITPYDGGDDGAVELANNSTYGLAGGIHGSDERAMAVARRIRTGSLMINSGMFYGADAPFGGYKMSGIGRQNGIEGFEQHLQTKTIGYPL